MLDELKKEYQNYIAWAARYQQNETLGQKLLHFVSGNRDFQRQPEHMQFYESVSVEAEVLLSQFQEDGESLPFLPLLLRYVFVDCYAGTNKKSSLMFLAADKLFMPHMELLTPGDAQELYLLYKQQRKKDPGLPLQGKIQKRLRQLAGLAG